MSRAELFLAGTAVSSSRRDVIDPWTREAFADAPLADDALRERAVLACVGAFERTKRTSSYARRDVCSKVAALLRARVEHVAQVIAHEAGKPITLAKAEVLRAASTFEIAAEVATRPRGEVIPLDLGEAHVRYTGRWERFPQGPVLAFAPFNFPLNLVAHKVAPALACGASVLVKPAPKTPLSSFLLADLVREAGAPEDALTVLPCEDAVAEKLVRDDRFRIFTFTGSAKVGYLLKGFSGKKHVLLELGGNAAAIVHEDAPEIARVLDALSTSAFAYAGQVCISTQRILVHHARFEEVVAGLRERAAALSPEEPASARGILGPVVDTANAERLSAWIAEAEGAGLEVVHRGSREENRLGATVLVEHRAQDADVRVVREEAFGPLVVVRPYDTFDEVIARVNDSRYGLQAGLFTDSAKLIEKAYRELDVGGLVVGDSASFRNDAMPYGGAKDSGLGREGVAFAVAEYTAPKMLVTRG
jgi:acyl-CoA reductase-like NAD-dependent aldehyde dehydrogenase